MPNGNILINQGTTTPMAVNSVGTVNYPVFKLDIGADGATSPFIGVGTTAVNTPGTITSGSITVIAGTIGTVGAIAQVHNAGTIAGGTIGEISNGTIRVVAGTVAVNTPGTITSGTVSVNTPGTITSGTVAVSAGTVNSGTINAGTINSGTINAGTIRDDGRPARNILSFGTTIAFGGSAFATLVGSAVVGAGTSIWVNDLSIVNHGGTVTAGIMFGSAINGSAVLAKGQFGANGGIEKAFPKAVNAGMTNFDLNAWADGASTVTFNVSYFISA